MKLPFSAFVVGARPLGRQASGPDAMVEDGMIYHHHCRIGPESEGPQRLDETQVVTEYSS